MELQTKLTLTPPLPPPAPNHKGYARKQARLLQKKQPWSNPQMHPYVLSGALIGSGKDAVTLVVIWDFIQNHSVKVLPWHALPAPHSHLVVSALLRSVGRSHLQAIQLFGCLQETDMLWEAGLGFPTESVLRPPSPLHVSQFPLPSASEHLPAHGKLFLLQKPKSKQQHFWSHTESV